MSGDLVVRPATAADAQHVADVYAPYVTESVATFELEPPDAAEMARRMSNGLPWYVAAVDEQVVGYAGATPHRTRPAYRWSVDVTAYVAADQTGRGLGGALYGRLLPALADLGHVRAHAAITLPNAPSVALHERAGFAQVARYPDVGFKHGAWHDVGWWSRPLREREERPAEPRRWSGG